jgi:hypothetical protein
MDQAGVLRHRPSTLPVTVYSTLVDHRPSSALALHI